MSDKLIIYCNMHNEPEDNCTKCATHIKELEILSWGMQKSCRKIVLKIINERK